MVILLTVGAVALILPQAIAPPVSVAACTESLRDSMAEVLHDRLAGETIDEPWAADAEHALDTLYATLPSIGRVAVYCAHTFCEVSGTIAPGEVQRGSDALHNTALHRAVIAAGFDELKAMSVRRGNDSSGKTSFVAYWTRSRAGTAAPRVIRTQPGGDAVLAPGPFTLRVTFDQPMRAGSVSFTMPVGLAAYPRCDGRPVQSADGRSFSMRCTAEARHGYVVGFNTPPFRHFVAAASGLPAEPETVRFRVR